MTVVPASPLTEDSPQKLQTWRFTAVRASNGLPVSGYRQGLSEVDLLESLSQDDFVGVQLKPSKVFGKLSNMLKQDIGAPSKDDVVTLYQSLSSSLDTGIDHADALNELTIALPKRSPLQPMVRRALAGVSDGSMSLADLFLASPEVFGREVGALVQAASEHDTLTETMDLIAQQTEHRAALRRSITSGLRSPTISLGLMLILTLVMIVGLTPLVPTLYEKLGAEDPREHLPQMTIWLLNIRAAVVGYWGPALLTAAALPLVWYLVRRSDTVREKMTDFWLSTPVVGTLIKGQEVMRVCSVLGAMLSAGIQDIVSLRIAGESAQYAPYRKSMLRAAHRRSVEGAPFDEVIGSTSPPMPTICRSFARQARRGIADPGKPWTALAHRTRLETERTAAKLKETTNMLILLAVTGMLFVMILGITQPMENAHSVVG